MMQKQRGFELVSLGRYLLIITLFFWSCEQEDDFAFTPGGKSPEDTGIYRVDSTQIDPFCDFVFEENKEGCWNDNLSVYRDCHYNLLFTRYGNGWTGSDATYSAALPDGRILWMFGDTFLGRVRADRSRERSPLIRNSFILQDGDEMTTLFGGTEERPSAIVKPTNPNEWYWPLDATVQNGEVQMMLGRLGSSGSGGMWDFGYRGFDLATFSLPDMKLQSIIPKIESPDISYGSAILEEDDYIYLYGISSGFLSKKGHVARVPSGDLDQLWEFYNGQDWVDTPSSFVILDGVSDQFSVFKDGGKYYFFTQEIIFGSRLFLYESDSPVGPWEKKRILYCTPQTGGDFFTYNAFVHPELSEEGELRISYNVNSFNFEDLFENADYYRPWFIRVDNWR